MSINEKVPIAEFGEEKDLCLYQMATSAPASAIALATSKPIPPAPPVMDTTFPFMENISQIESDMGGSGRRLFG